MTKWRLSIVTWLVLVALFVGFYRFFASRGTGPTLMLPPGHTRLEAIGARLTEQEQAIDPPRGAGGVLE